jgi:hypothetical protein
MLLQVVMLSILGFGALTKPLPAASCCAPSCCCCCISLQVVMLSILGFGALTKPLLAAMLKGNSDASLRDQLRTIPLLRFVKAEWCNLVKLGQFGQGVMLHGDEALGATWSCVG